MMNIIEFAEKNKDELSRLIDKIEKGRGKEMKNNKVRMNISREMHEWFSAIDGKTNDERMAKLRNNREANSELISEIDSSEAMKKYWFEKWVIASNNNSILKGLLALSMAVSIISVSYLAYVQGWFL